MKSKSTYGVVLAGGLGTRLYPLTKSFSKHLLNIYDKPMIYYSLSMLFLAKIKKIIIISTLRDMEYYKNLLGDGSHYGVNFFYVIQEESLGIPHALYLTKKIIKNNKICLVLGDNFIYSDNLVKILVSTKKKEGSSIFCYKVDNPSEYGVLEKSSTKIMIKEKPKKTSSKLAIIGLYFLDNNFFKYFDQIQISKRGEYEITDILNIYLKHDKLSYEVLGRGAAWYDAGSFENMLKISNYVNIIQTRQNNLVSCLEEIALSNKWISKKYLKNIFAKIKNYNSYTRYVWNLANSN